MKKTVDLLTPFETEHVVQFVRTLTVRGAISNPWFIGIFLIFAFYAIVKRSKFVLGVLFASSAILLLIHYTIPSGEDTVSLSATIPFALGGVAIGLALVYFYFIKTE